MGRKKERQVTKAEEISDRLLKTNDKSKTLENNKSAKSSVCKNFPGIAPLLSHKFEDLPVSESIKKGLNSMGLTDMTEIQWKCIPHLLEWRDVMGTAKTGSGKTIAFLIPLVERILQTGMRGLDGTGAIIIAPTRELSLQIYSVLKQLTAYSQIRIGLIMGGSNRQAEAENLQKGVTILVATPGRLLDHLRGTDNFIYQDLKVLVIDEADRLLDIGFELEMDQIIRLLSKDRQSVFFSATLNEKTYKLAKSALKSSCIMVGVEEQSNATVETLEQGYVICDPVSKFCLLYSFIRRNQNKKIMIFMSACLEVKFYYELLNFIDIPVRAIHGRQKQAKRTSTFVSFVEAQSAVLLCTNVGARGLDIPEVDWIVQFDPPDDPKDYIHRVGRTARAGKLGKALLMLRPHELGFLEVLRKSKVTPVEFEVAAGKLLDIQSALEKVISSNEFLTISAQEAFQGVVRSYNSSKLACFNINELDLAALSKNFGLQTVPKVHLGIKQSKYFDPRRMKRKPFGNASTASTKKRKFN